MNITKPITKSQLDQYCHRMRKAIGEACDSHLILQRDVIKAFDEMTSETNADKSRFRERNYVRTVFAYVEGCCYGLRQICFLHDVIPNAVKLPVNVTHRLKEIDPVTHKPKYLYFEDSVKESFKYVAVVTGFVFCLDCNSPGWEALKRAKIIRDRLAHPKKAHQLIVTAKEIAETTMAVEWFSAELNRLFYSPRRT